MGEKQNMRWLPVGSWEPHGGHLPYDTDTLIAAHLAQGCARESDTLLPAIPYGCSFEHRGLGHFVSLSVSTLAALVTEIVRAASDPLVILNGHGGNQVLHSLVPELNSKGSRVLLLPSRDQWDQAYQAAGWDFRLHDDMHAGAMERSLLLVWEPNRVRETTPPDVAAPDRPLFTAEGMRRYTPHGHIGFPSQASAEAGHRAIHSLLTALKETVSTWSDE